MEYERVGDFLIKNGCYLCKISSTKFDRDSYELAQKILTERRDQYRKARPLLLPLMRGGSRPFLHNSGSFKKVLKIDSKDKDIDYIPIKISRYQSGEIDQESEIRIDEMDIAQAVIALRDHEEGILLDDVLDRGLTADMIKNRLSISGRNILVATVYRKPEANQTSTNADYWVEDYFRKEIGCVLRPPWLVFPWEIDDHSRELWELLFPEFNGTHPELAWSANANR